MIEIDTNIETGKKLNLFHTFEVSDKLPKCYKCNLETKTLIPIHSFKNIYEFTVNYYCPKCFNEELNNDDKKNI